MGLSGLFNVVRRDDDGLAVVAAQPHQMAPDAAKSNRNRPPMSPMLRQETNERRRGRGPASVWPGPEALGRPTKAKGGGRSPPISRRRNATLGKRVSKRNAASSLPLVCFLSFIENKTGPRLRLRALFQKRRNGTRRRRLG